MQLTVTGGGENVLQGATTASVENGVAIFDIRGERNGMWQTHTLWFDTAIVLGLFAVGSILFGHFEEHKPKWRRLRLILICLVAAACGHDTSDDWRGSVDTLPSGVIHVSNPDRGLWPTPPPWQIVQLAKIGTRLDSGPEVFGDIIDIEVDPWGRVYIFDRQAQEVRLFDADGSYVRTLGRPGRGPGEFVANGIVLDSAQQLWVFNQGNMRYSVFDSAGALVTELPRPVGAVRFAEWTSTFTVQGELYEALGYRDSTGTQFRLARYDTVGQAFVDTLALPRFPVGTKLFWGVSTLTPTGWWIGVKDTYRIAHVTFRGDTTRIVEVDRTPVPLAADARDSAIQFERELSQRVTSGEYAVETSLQPLFDRLAVDDRGYLWVMLAADSAEGRTPFDVFDPDVRYLGSITAPHVADPLMTPVVRHDRMYYVTKDEFDVPYVVVAAIEGRN